MKYRADIDGLRAVAVISVVVYHALPSALPGGFIGVDIFFVISGYLITKLITEQIALGEFSFFQFYNRRILRLAPAFIAVSLASSVMAYFFYAPDDLERFSKSVVASILLHANHFFLKNTGYFEAPEEVTPMLHMWSLSVEEQFYIFFPILLVFLARFRISNIKVIGAIGLCSFLAACMLVLQMQEAVFFLLPFRAWELILGSMIALCSIQAGAKSSLIGGMLIAAPLVLLDDASIFPAWNALAPCIGAALIITGSNVETLNRFLAMPLINYIGRTSYSLYLWHWPVIAFTTYLLGREMSLYEGIAAVAACFCLGSLSYHFVEIPFRRGVNTRLFAGCLTSSFILLLAMVYIDKNDGAPWRLPPNLAAFSDAARRQAGPPLAQCAINALIAKDARLQPLEEFNEARICKIGDQSAEVKVIFWGDSHANAIAPALENWLRENKIAAYSLTRGGCPPLVKIDRYDEPQWKCLAFHQAALRVTQSVKPSTMFITARWAYYVEGRGFGKENGRSPRLGLTNEGNPLVVTRALQETLELAKAATQQVALIGPAPEIGEDVTRGLAQRFFQMRPMEVSVDLDLVRARQARTTEILRIVSSTHNVPYIDLLSSFCGEEKCIGGTSDELVYLDSNHMAPTAAVKVATKLIPYVSNQ